MPRVLRASTGTAMPTGSVMPTTSAVSMIAVCASTRPAAASRGASEAPGTARVRRVPPCASIASSVPSPPSAIGQPRTIASGRARRRPAAIASVTCCADKDPLNESGAMTTTGADGKGCMVSPVGYSVGVATFAAAAAGLRSRCPRRWRVVPSRADASLTGLRRAANRRDGMTGIEARGARFAREGAIWRLGENSLLE